MQPPFVFVLIFSILEHFRFTTEILLIFQHFNLQFCRKISTKCPGAKMGRATKYHWELTDAACSKLYFFCQHIHSTYFYFLDFSLYFSVKFTQNFSRKFSVKSHYFNRKILMHHLKFCCRGKKIESSHFYYVTQQLSSLYKNHHFYGRSPCN